MGIGHSPKNTGAISKTGNPSSGAACSVCEKDMGNLQDCFETKCKHKFHKSCITGWLEKSQECPNCQKLAHVKDLVEPKKSQETIGAGQVNQTATGLEKSVNTPNVTGRGRGRGRGKHRGSAGRHLQGTRSGRAFHSNDATLPDQVGHSGDRLRGESFREPANNTVPLLDVNSSVPKRKSGTIPDNLQNNLHNSINKSRNNEGGNCQGAIDPATIAQMVETTVRELLINMTWNSPPQPRCAHFLERNSENNRDHVNFGESNARPENSQRSREASTSSPEIHFQRENPTRNSNTYSQFSPEVPPYNQVFSNNHLSPEKITSIILNWNVKFDGSSSGLRCDEFIYRIRCLTHDNFNGNFNWVCRNLHVLLTGKARNWYWHYHKRVESIVWDDFCSALCHQYQDYRTNSDIREELRSRKQKPSENFEVFYDAITEIVERLPSPIEEHDLVEIVTRNLRPEIRHELLYVRITSIAELRKVCQMRENLFSDENFRKNQFSRNSQNVTPFRRVNALDSTDCCIEALDNGELDNEDNIFPSVNAISKPEKTFICWNCDGEGHRWDMCLKERRIFCYGCGLKDIYKPQCPTCLRNSENQQRGSFKNTRMTPK